MWIYTTRPGYAADLAEEIGGRAEGDALVFAERAPRAWPIFARAGFPLAAPVAPDQAASAVAPLVDARKPWMLVAWVPDSDATNPLEPAAQAIGDRVLAELARRGLRPSGPEVARYGGLLVQLCLAAPDRLLVGALPAADSPTLRPGGRARASMPGDAPSRAGRKLAEAFEWIGRGPEPGELCVDLGAAPGGWSAVVLARRARVIAVDPAQLALKRKGLVHVKASAFDFIPDEPVDWLLCDMAWRPLEVAALLAKWGRRRLATALVANIKLPMKQRVAFAKKVAQIVAGGGWQDVRARQLYHDRDEFTLAAWRV